MKTTISRRTLLRGIGGIALALPALEIMGASRAAAGPSAIPKRYAVMYGGQSTGTYVGSTAHADMTVPMTVGPSYELTHGLKPLGDLGVQDAVAIVSGLVIPWNTDSSIPPGGRVVEFHGCTVVPQISGTRSTGREKGPSGPTSDQIVANAIGQGTVVSSLAYRVQPVTYDGTNGGGGNEGRISWKQDAGDVVGIDPIVSPRAAFQYLTSSFTPPDPAAAKQADFELRRRKSVLDLVQGSIGELMPKLGHADQIRLERHLEEVRALEKQLEAVAPPSSSCTLVADPGPDPAIAGAIVGDGVNYASQAGYSDEDKRADVFTDLIAMAFACDLTRAASLQLTMWKCYMNMNPLYGWQSDLHNLSHGGGPLEALSDGVAWHVKQLARLMAKLKDKTEVDGSSVLDHTAAVLLFEGGHGKDPEGGTSNSPHATENMAVLIGGHAGGLRGGVHVAASGKHPAQVVLSAMQAVGVSGPLGDVSGTIPELFA